jgi:hypothetical protein
LKSDAVGSAPVVEQFRDSGLYGFAREGKGYYIVSVRPINDAVVSVATTLPDGEYTNLLGGETVTIKDGMLNATLPPETAIAIVVD